MRRGTRVGSAYVSITADGDGINEEIVDSVDASGDDVEKSGKDHGERYGDSFGEGFRERLARVRGKVEKALADRLADSGEDSGEGFTKRFANVLERHGDKIGASFGDRVAEAISDRLELTIAAMLDTMEEVSRNSSKAGRGPRAPKPPKRDLGDSVGGLLGAGSRNNVLNLLGRSIGNIISLAEKARQGAGNLFKTFIKGFQEAGEGASIFQRLMGGLTGGAGAGGALSKAFSSLASSGPAAVAALSIVLVTMSALASVASALTAILVALTSTIVSALTGAVLVLGGAFAAAATAGGLLTLAFMSMTDAQKNMLSTAFQPLKAELVGLGQLMITQMIPYFKVWSENLQQALVLVGPLAQVMGQAFGEAGAALTSALSGPGFQRFWAVMKTELPTITQNMSTALGSFLNGLMGTFAALMPFVTRFSEYLVRVTEKFSDWANSASGQNAIVDFADRALDSLKSLWGFVKEFSGFLKDVLFSPQAQSAGNSMFDDLRDKFKDFRADVKRFAESGELEKWFTDARNFAEDFGDAVAGVKRVFTALNNSGVLDAVGSTLEYVGAQLEIAGAAVEPLINWFGKAIPKAIDAAETAFDVMASAMGPFIDVVSSAVSWVDSLIGKINSIPSLPSALTKLGNLGGGLLGAITPRVMTGGRPTADEPYTPAGEATGPFTSPYGKVISGSSLLARTKTSEGGGQSSDSNAPTIAELIALGNAALNGRGGGGGKGGSDPVSGNGGGKGDKDGHKKWKNPYIKLANSLIKDGPTVAQQLKNAMKQMRKEIARAINEADSAVGGVEAQSVLTQQMQSLRDTARNGVQLAQDALNSAAENLKSASTKKEAERALKAVLAAQKDLAKALKNQKHLNAAASVLSAQRVVNPENVQKLMDGLKVQNATLADYAEARERVALKLEAANQKLNEAIELKRAYGAQVADSVKSFGNLITAQGKVLDGVQLAVTAGDIVSNLQDRLTKIKTFQSNLQILLAQGLSNDAYKQIVDAGVEGGSAYAQALVDGGSGAVGAVNSLVGQIGGLADELGLETSTRLYQAGVDAAQGLVDGLESLSDKLDAASARLGERIARAIAKALGIKTPKGPSARMAVDEAVTGPDVASRVSRRVAVSPEVAAYAASQRQVSGNQPPVNDLDITVITPTEDPVAVANEVINEVVGRL